MKTEADINKDILEITMTIEETFSELSKYITEIPVGIPFSVTSETNLKNLQDYYETLETLLKNYRKNHKGIIN